MYSWLDFQNTPNIVFEKADKEIDLTIDKQRYVQEIEELLGKQIPEDYKCFCQIFGTVSIDDFAEVYRPNFWMYKFWMEVLKNDVKSRANIKNRSIILSFIDKALWFGSTDNTDLLFDLTNSNELNTSCHVYMLQKSSKKLHFVSDSFFNFITQFCFGNVKSNLPKKISPNYAENHTLRQFDKSFSEADYEDYLDSCKSLENQFENFLTTLNDEEYLRVMKKLREP